MIGSTVSFDPWKFLAYKDECDGGQLEEPLKDHLVNVALCAKSVACGLNTRLGRRELDEGVAFVAGLPPTISGKGLPAGINKMVHEGGF